eukprot:m.144888 g.144888  ORF g.144888 m.144888 type:complete len:690 (+) comp16053_c4_seq1:581-2650(+)
MLAVKMSGRRKQQRSASALAIFVVLCLCHVVDRVNGGTLSVLVKGGKVQDRDGSSNSDPKASIRVVDVTDWLYTDVVGNDNNPTWNKRLTFPDDNIPSSFSLKLHVVDYDGKDNAADDLGTSTKVLTFDSCDEAEKSVRFDNLRGTDYYVDVSVTYTPTNLCMTNNGNCGPETSTECSCIADAIRFCNCVEGYDRSSTTDCAPINNCLRGFSDCDLTSTKCRYTGPGTHACDCKQGYEKTVSTTSSTSCAPIDPCAKQPGRCGLNSTCIYDGPGLYHCECIPGYESSDGSNCHPINNCITGISGCNLTSTTCRYTGPATNACDCKEGYERNSTMLATLCDPIDPCEKEPERCGSNAICIYAGPGLHYCECAPNYESATDDGSNCQPLNNCENDSYGGCDASTQTCIYTGPGTNTCTCRDGYQPDAGSCVSTTTVVVVPTTMITTTSSSHSGGQAASNAEQQAGLSPSSWGAIAGGVVGLVVLIGLFLVLRRSRVDRKVLDFLQSQPPATQMNPTYAGSVGSQHSSRHRNAETSDVLQPKYAELSTHSRASFRQVGEPNLYNHLDRSSNHQLSTHSDPHNGPYSVVDDANYDSCFISGRQHVVASHRENLVGHDEYDVPRILVTPKSQKTLSLQEDDYDLPRSADVPLQNGIQENQYVNVDDGFDPVYASMDTPSAPPLLPRRPRTSSTA